MEQINLDLIPGKVKPICHASQYDIGRIIRLNLYMDGLPYTLTGAETISIMLRKSNFVVIIEEVTNTSSSYVEIETTENTCDVSGEYECELRVEDNEINIGSANFKMVVEPDAFDGQLAISTASGKIASFYTSLEEDLVENKIAFSATQDLHGQSAPYPAGGGKNLFGVADATYSDLSVTVRSDGSVLVNGTADVNHSFPVNVKVKAGSYVLSCAFTGTLPSTTTGRVTIYNGSTYVTGITNNAATTREMQVLFENDTTITCNIMVDGNFNYQNVVLYPQLELGSSASTFAPYENICPIVGVDKVNVTRTGKNLLEGTIASAGINASGVISSSLSNNVIYAPCKAGEKYTVTSSGSILVYAFYTSKPIKTSESYNSIRSQVNAGTATITAEIDGFIAVRITDTDTTPQIEYGERSTAYEAPTVVDKTIDLGGTYYGGLLDVVARKMIIDKNIIVIDGSQTLNISSQSYIKPLSCDCYINNDDIYPRVAAQSQPDNFAYCDKLKPVKKTIWNVDGDINCMTINTRQMHLNIANELLGITDYTQETIETVKTKMQAFLQNNPVTVVFCINPVIIDLTEENVYEVSGSTVQFEAHIAKSMKTVETNFVSSQASGSPTPASPIPIVGVDKVNVICCGKNLLVKSFDYYSSVGTNLSDYFFIKAGTYRFSFDTSTADNWRFVVRMKDKDGNDLSSSEYQPRSSGVSWSNNANGWLNTSNLTSKSLTYTFVSDCYIRILFGYGNTSSSTTMTNAQLEIGETATDYEAPTVVTALTNLGSTYYGGSVDAVTGKIMLTHGYIEYDGSEDEPWTAYAASTYYGFQISNWDFLGNNSEGLCNRFKVQANYSETGVRLGATQGGNHVFYFVHITDSLSGVTDVASWRAWLANNPVTIVYPLETPIVVYASNTVEIPTIVGKNIVFTDAEDVRVEYYDTPAPNPIYITTLNGENNIYSDTNGDITVKYYKNIND